MSKRVTIRLASTGRSRREAEHLEQTGGLTEPEPPAPPEERDEPLGLVGDPPDFPAGALPVPLQPFVAEVARASNCRPDAVAAGMLAATSGALGNARLVDPDGNHPTHANVYVAIVGDSGSGKTPALARAFAPLDVMDRELNVCYQTTRESYQREKRDFEKALAAWKKREHGAQPVEPARPPQERLLMSDLTIAALMRALKDSPRGITLKYDELSAWLRDMNRFSNGKGSDREKFLSAWSGDPIKVSRKGDGDEGDLYVAHPYLTIAGNLVPGVLHKLIEEGRKLNDGLLSRFLLVNLKPLPASGEIAPRISAASIKLWDRSMRRLRYEVKLPGRGASQKEPPASDPPRASPPPVGPRLAILGDEGLPDWVATAEQSVAEPEPQGDTESGVDDAREEPGRSGPDAAGEGLLELSDDAFSVYAAFRREHADEINAPGFDPALRSAWDKLLSGWSRLLLILHAMRWACNEDGIAHADPEFTAPIEAITAERAGRLVAYFKGQILFAHGQAAASEEDHTLAKLLAWIRRQSSPSVCVRDVQRYFPADPELRTKEGAERALEGLVRRGTLQVLPAPEGKRKSRYAIPPEA